MIRGREIYGLIYFEQRLRYWNLKFNRSRSFPQEAAFLFMGVGREPLGEMPMGKKTSRWGNPSFCHIN
jgi:hypothetical protein